MDDIEIPDYVLYNWQTYCTCCPVCQQKPCDGAMCGGLCDDACNCDDEDYLDGEDNEQP